MPAERPPGGDDPFEGLEFDEDFVAAASHREETADERVARLQRAYEQHRDEAESRSRELEQARLRMRDRPLAPEPPAYAARRRSRWRQRVAVTLVVALLGLAFWSSRQRGPQSSTADVPAATDAAAARLASGGELPPPGVDEQSGPLGAPAPLPAGSGPYTFLATQEDGVTPVAYNPCRPIHVVLNDRTAPADGDALVQSALDRVSQATGLHFVVDGPTAEAAGDAGQRAAYQPDRYPGRWAPVLIAWSDRTESPVLAGDVAGFGGSSAVTDPNGTVYVSGSVVLDGPDFHTLIREEGNEDGARAVIEHELGHLVGLAHVNDPTQVMNPDLDPHVTDYGVGDLDGLDQLGRGRCFPEV